MTIALSQHDSILGIFRPKNLDTLRPECRSMIGCRFRFDPVWIIEEGPYAGQWAFLIVGPEREKPGHGAWFPEEDIEITRAWEDDK